MYRKPSPQMTIDDFILPFAGKFAADNRWVKLAALIPWDEIEKQYAFMFPSDRGNVAKPVRMALGALIIQTRSGFTDRETVQQITENPYMQYFIGLREYQLTRPFTPAAMVKFRKRFNAKRLADINEKILQAEKSKQELEIERDDEHHDNDSGCSGNPEEKNKMSEEEAIAEADARPNQGTLILDATCTPADISFPTDHRLLNEAREQLGRMIDTLHQTDGKGTRRPRTYKQNKKQLQYVRRNLQIVDQMLVKVAEQNEICPLSPRQEKLLTVIRKLYEQQEAMYKNRSHRISDRIVNIYQSHVRPIVRGKAGAAVEFGAKVAISLEDGYSRIEKLSWDPFNEAGAFEETVERYRERHGCYPEAVLADMIYRNRDNLSYCKKHHIRLSGPRLGRPPANSLLQKAEKRLDKMDARQRNAVEGKFGEGKRKYSLGRVAARLKETAECMIAMQFLVMNLEHKLRVLFLQIWIRLFLKRFDTVLANYKFSRFGWQALIRFSQTERHIMRTILRRMHENFLGWHLPLRVRLFNMMGFAGIGIALISSIVSILNGEPLVSTLANLITALIASALIYYASRSGRYQICYIITIIVLFLIMFPVIFFLAGAYHGAMPYFFIFAAVFTVLMLESRKAFLFVLLELSVYIAICIHAYYSPRAIFMFASEATRLRDIVIGFTICSIALSIILYLHFREFLEQQRQLETAREDAVLASQAKSNFLANMSHEIRTPINVILGMNEMVLRDSTSEDISTYGISIQNAGKTLLNIINDILDVAKIETGKLELMKEQYRTADLIADLVMIGLELSHRKGLRFSIHADENLPVELVGDFLHVKQIVANFISNAVKYTERGSVALSVYQKPGPSSWGRDVLLGLSVADTGIGIKAENLNALFEAFVQVNVRLHRHAEGAGLGLAIAKELTEHMGGRIYVESSFGEGSVFTVEIPQSIGAAEPMGPLILSGNKPPRPREKGFIAPQGSVLVVDDNEENLQVIKALLSSTMLRVDAAASGHECLELVKSNHYHIIFIDYMMPDLDGIATRRRLQEKIEGFSVPTISFTANVIAGVRQMLLDAGFDAYMPKPVMWNDLKKMLLQYLPAEIVIWDENKSQLPDAENLIEEMKQELADYGIELAKGLHYVDGNIAQYLTIAKIFTDNYGSEIDKIARLAGAGDIKRLTYEIHSLKSKTLSLGAVHLHDLAAQLEKRCRAEDADYIKTALPLLFFEWERAKTGLERFNSPKGEQAPAAGDNEKGSTGVLLEYIRACRRKEARQELDRIAAAGGIDGIDLNAVRHAIEEFDFEEAEQFMLV